MNHPRRELDPVIHSPVRFSIIAALSAVERADFGYIRDAVEISDSSLSQHVTTLERAGYLKVAKGQAGRRSKTWLSLTPEGHAAFTHHLVVFNRIASDPPVPDRPVPDRPVGDGEA